MHVDIRQLVVSPCRDGADVQYIYMQYAKSFHFEYFYVQEHSFEANMIAALHQL